MIIFCKSKNVGVISSDCIDYVYICSDIWFTCNAAVLDEIGRHNLYVHYFCKSVKFWLSIVQDNIPRLRNTLYCMMKGLDDVDRHTASEIKLSPCVYGCRHMWLNQGVGDNSLFIETEVNGHVITRSAF